MRIYGDTPFFEKNGFAMVEVWDINEDGKRKFRGYALLNPESEEIDFFESYEDALAELERLTEDNDDDSAPPPP